MDGFKEQSNFRKHLNYFFTRLYLAKQEMKEYKTNFWSMFFFDIILFSTIIFSYTVIQGLVSDYLPWTMKDFFLLFVLNLLMYKFFWLHNLRGFQATLLSGELNIYLTKPINAYFARASKFINWQNTISGIIIYLLVMCFIYFNNYTNFLLAFLLSIFSFVYFMALSNLLESIEFHMKNSAYITNIVRVAEHSVHYYTPRTFKNTRLGFLAFFLPSSIAAYLVIEILNNRLDEFFTVLPFIILTFLLLCFGIYILWKIGLKRYEAFG